MNKLFNKIDRLRASKVAMLDLRPSSPYFHLDGQSFPIHHIGTPGLKCPVVLIVEGKELAFTIDDIR